MIVIPAKRSAAPGPLCRANLATISAVGPHLNSVKTFCLYSAICLADFLFISVRLPETRGRSLEELERDLVNKPR